MRPRQMKVVVRARAVQRRTEVERLQSAKRRLHLRRAVVGAHEAGKHLYCISQHFVQIPETTSQRNVGSGDVIFLSEGHLTVLQHWDDRHQQVCDTNTSGSSTPVSQAPTVGIGLWKEQGATHKVTHKRVSVQTLDKRVEMEGSGSYPWYGRLLFDCYIVLMIRVLEEMVKPLEETRTELIFTTEPVLSSLQLLIPWNSHHTLIVEFNEIEV